MGEQVSERESLARVIFAASPPSNPHGPDSDLVFDEPYTHFETERALRSADAVLAWFAAHQPARVVPSAEEVAGVLGEFAVGREMPTDAPIVTAVLALFASQPTVAEVREQVARELEALLPTDDEVPDPQPCSAGHDCHEAARYVTVRRAQRIARTETKGGE